MNSQAEANPPRLDKTRKLTQFLCSTFLLIGCITCFVKFKEIEHLFSLFVEWMRVHPYLGACVVVLMYVT